MNAVTVFKAGPREYLAWLGLLGDCWGGTHCTDATDNGRAYMELVRRWER